MTNPGSPNDPQRALTAREFLEQMDAGVDVLDVRSGPDYAASHLRSSIFIGISQMFPNWVQALLDPSRPVQIIAEPGHESMVFASLKEVGIADLRGFLDGGFASLASFADRLTSTERVDSTALAAELDQATPPHVIDVRQPQEWQQGRIGSAPNIPLTEFEKRVSEVPTDGRVILQCQGGYRSLIAASYLERAGHASTIDMEGGFGAWAQSGLPVQPAG